VKTIAVIGAGTMGSGIAQLAATNGCRVHLIDVNGDVVRQGVERIGGFLNRAVEKGRMSAEQRDAALERIVPGETIEGLEQVELAVEAVVEKLEIKHDVFRKLDETTPPFAILATNTSSLSISDIATAVSDPRRVIGMHFFNPAPIMPLVEVIAGKQSARECVDRAYETAHEWGKSPVRVKDTPGFIVNRVARGFYLESLRLLDEGVAGVYEIDQVMKNHGNFRMGPFELMDLVGLDVNLAVSTSVWEQMNKPARLTPHHIQRNLVSEGHLGRKTGRGFYKYEDGAALPAVPVDRRSFSLTPALSAAMTAFCERGGVTNANSTEQYVFARVLSAIINEAALALGEEVATSGDIDLAMRKGTNYPQGPLEWAEKIGHRNVRAVLKSFNELTDDGRYQPAPLFG